MVGCRCECEVLPLLKTKTSVSLRWTLGADLLLVLYAKPRCSMLSRNWQKMSIYNRCVRVIVFSQLNWISVAKFAQLFRGAT